MRTYSVWLIPSAGCSGEAIHRDIVAPSEAALRETVLAEGVRVFPHGFTFTARSL